MKNLKGKFVSLIYQDRKETISGFLVDTNKKWTLLKYNNGDYVIDGYLLLKTKNIEKFKRDKFEKFQEKVLKAKKLNPTKKDALPIKNLAKTLKKISDKYGAFMIEKKDETVGYVGKFKKMSKKYLTIKEVDTRANWVEKEKFKLDSIRVISFDNDYVNSLMTYNKKTDKKKSDKKKSKKK